jgi:hypothetical protein
MHRFVCGLFVSVYCSVAVAAPSERVLAARKLVDDLQLEPALKLLDSIEKDDANDRDTLLELYFLQGVASGTLGKGPKTKDAFRRLLTLNPQATLPADLPPRVRTPFFEAKEWVERHGALTVTPLADVKKQVEGVSVSVIDMLHLVKMVRFRFKLQGQEEIVEIPLVNGHAEAAIQAKRLVWSVELLSERDSVLLTMPEREDGPEPVVPPKNVEPKEVVVSPPPPALKAPIVFHEEATWRRPDGIGLLGAGAVATGFGVFMGLQATNARNKVTTATKDASDRIVGLTQKEAGALEATAQSQAVAANILFGIGGVMGAAGAVLVILGPTSAPTLAATPAPGGVSLSGSF